MAFIKKDWKCGDTITADDLNRLEGGVEEALECCSDKGYSCTEEWVTLTDESVTTETSEGALAPLALLAYTDEIKADSIKVTFDGTEYTCNKTSVDDGNAYGGISAQVPDFSEYPFIIFSSQENNVLYTETAGTYQVKIETFEETIETSECFDKAVEQSTQPLFVNASPMIGGGLLSTPFIDIYNAFKQGRRVIVDMSNTFFEITSVSRDSVLGGGSVVGNGHTYTASTDDAYPSYSDESNPIT